MKSFLGIGILGLSYGFLKTGFLLAIIVLIIVYIACYYTSTLLIGFFNNFRNLKRLRR